MSRGGVGVPCIYSFLTSYLFYNRSGRVEWAVLLSLMDALQCVLFMLGYWRIKRKYDQLEKRFDNDPCLHQNLLRFLRVVDPTYPQTHGIKLCNIVFREYDTEHTISQYTVCVNNLPPTASDRVELVSCKCYIGMHFYTP